MPDDPDGPRAIADLDVDLIILHPWQGDLIVELEHVDDGLRVPLLYRPGDSDGTGAGFSADNIGSPATGGKFIFDDEGGEFYDGLPPDGIGNVPHPGIADVTGPWIPYGSQVSGLTRTLSSFDGHDRRGTWRLWVSDNEPEDTGSILNFSLHFSSCHWDLDGNGTVGIGDLLVLFSLWGTAGPLGDFNGDGNVGIADMLLMFANWGPCPQAPECGNGVVEPGEECDGADDEGCPGKCQPDCTCMIVLECGGHGSGDCCQANGTPACEDEICCDMVCEIDPFCCVIEWDVQCANEAAQLCDCPL